MTGPFLVHGAVPARTADPIPDAPPHLRVSMGELAILLSPSALSGEAEPDAAEVLRHNRILVAAACGGGVIPVRFGMAVSSPDAARRSLAGSEADFARALARLDGRVEYLARISTASRPDAPDVGRPGATPAPGDAPEPRCGDWLRAKAAARRRGETARRQAEDAALVLADALAAAAELVRTARPAGLLLELALLCRPGEGERALTAALSGAAARVPQLHVELTGPWPPYASLEHLMEPAS